MPEDHLSSLVITRMPRVANAILHPLFDFLRKEYYAMSQKGVHVLKSKKDVGHLVEVAKMLCKSA